MPKRRKAIIWTSDCLVWWCIFVSLGVNKLTLKVMLIFVINNLFTGDQVPLGIRTSAGTVMKKFNPSSNGPIYMYIYINYSDVITTTMASQITGVSIVCSTVCSGTDQRKDQSFPSLAFVRGIHWWLVDSPHKGPVMQKMFPFDDVIMIGLVLEELNFRLHPWNQIHRHY